jgi:adenylate cyclase class IV
MKNIEVEFRFQVENEKAVRDFLNKLRFIEKLNQKDVYLDTLSGDMFKRGIFIRTRNNSSLDFKFNLEDKENKHEECDEYSFPLPIKAEDLNKLREACNKIGLETPPIADIGEFTKTNKLEEFVVIDKVRERFSDGEFKFCFDRIKEFGNFLEIELMATKDTDIEELKRRMVERVMVLNPKFLPTGYIELFVKKKNFDLYKQGRYILDEDKE